MWVVESYAKINIFLEITDKKEAHHILHSLFCRIGICDTITITPSQQFRVSYSINIENDIITKTVNVLKKYFPNINTNFHFDVLKNIPLQAGLGGGSSNAGCAMKFLLLHNNVEIPNDKMFAIGEEIGADVPFFLQNSPAILHGIGKELYSVNFKIPKMWCVIYLPDFGLSTKEIFLNAKGSFCKFRAVTSFEEALLRQNALQMPANIVSGGKISPILTQLFHKKAIKTAMSGSGSVCFSLFTEENHANDCALVIQSVDAKVIVTEVLTAC